MAKRKSGMVTMIILFAVIVGVVLTIVFINIFTPKTTTALAELMTTSTSSGYLSDSYTNNDDIDEYLTYLCENVYGINVYDDVFNEEDIAQIYIYQNSMEAFRTMGQFFARELVYTTYTSTYKNNYSKIKADLYTAKSEVDSLASYLEKNFDMASETVTSLKLTWVDCEDQVTSILTSTADAISRLMDVYSSCVDSKVMNNDFTTMLFQISSNYVDAILDGTIVSTDVPKLATIASTYFTKAGESYIISYSYDESLQTKTQSLLTDGIDSTYFESFLNGFGG